MNQVCCGLTGSNRIKAVFLPVPAGETQKKEECEMRMKTLGMMSIRIVLRLSVAILLIGIPNISAVADGGQVPYPTGSGPTVVR